MFLQECELTHGCITRWVLFLWEYELKIEYCKGSENMVITSLSRMNEGGEVVDHKELHVWALQSNDDLKMSLKN